MLNPSEYPASASSRRASARCSVQLRRLEAGIALEVGADERLVRPWRSQVPHPAQRRAYGRPLVDPQRHGPARPHVLPRALPQDVEGQSHHAPAHPHVVHPVPQVRVVARLALHRQVVALTPGPAIQPTHPQRRVHRRSVRHDHKVDPLQVRQPVGPRVLLPVRLEAPEPHHAVPLVLCQPEGPRANRAHVQWGDVHLPLLDPLLHQMLRVPNLQPRVAQHVRVQARALSQGHPQPVARQHLHPAHVPKVALEQRREPGPPPRLCAESGQLEPELGVIGREGRAVVPIHAVADREGPLREVGV